MVEPHRLVLTTNRAFLRLEDDDARLRCANCGGRLLRVGARWEPLPWMEAPDRPHQDRGWIRGGPAVVGREGWGGGRASPRRGSSCRSATRRRPPPRLGRPRPPRG